MKIDFVKLVNRARWGACTLFIALAMAGVAGIITGNFLHIITLSGSLAMAYAIAKEW